jgi:hypothetical protein
MRITIDGAPDEVKISCPVRNGGKAGNIDTVGLPIVIKRDFAVLRPNRIHPL